MVSKWARLTFKVITSLMAISIFTVALSLDLLHLYLPRLTQNKASFSHWASGVLHRPVKMDAVNVRWSHLTPIVDLNNVVVSDPNDQHASVHLGRLSIGINLLSSLYHWQILPASINLSQLHVVVKQQSSGSFSLLGFNFGQDNRVEQNHALEAMLHWVLLQSLVQIRQVDIDWIWKNGVVQHWRDLQLNAYEQQGGHRLVLDAHLAHAMHADLHLIFHLPDAGDLSKGRGFLQLHSISLSQWYDIWKKHLAFSPLSVQSGYADASVWFDWAENHLQTVQSHLEMNHLSFLREKSKLIMLPYFSANILASFQPHGRWHLTADNIQTNWGGHVWKPNAFSAEVQPSKVGAIKKDWSIAIAFLPLSELHQFVLDSGLFKGQGLKYYLNLHPTGELQHLVLHQSFDQSLHPVFDVKTQFQSISFQSYKNIPGLSDLSGTLHWSPKGSDLQLASKQVLVHAPRVFSKSLFFDVMDANLHWTRAQGHWSLMVNDLFLKNKDLQTRLQFNCHQDGQYSPVIDLVGGYHMFGVSNLSSYIPLSHVKLHLRTWLSHAFSGDASGEGSVVLRGPLNHFPYVHHHGTFQLKANLHHLGFQYAKSWPAFQLNQARLLFSGPSMTVDKVQGSYHGASISALASIANLHHPLLKVNGQVIGPMKAAGDFLRASPLEMGRVFAHAKMHGAMQTKLALQLPLHHLHRSRVSGTVILNQAHLVNPAWLLDMNHIDGRLLFTKNSLVANQLKGDWSGSPIKVDIKTIHPGMKTNHLLLHAQGLLAVPSLRQQLNLPVLHFIHGSSFVDVTLKLNHIKSSSPDVLQVRSDLKGIETYGVPAVLTKFKNDKKKLAMTLFLPSSQSMAQEMTVNTSYGKILRASFLLKKQGRAYQTTAAIIALQKKSLPLVLPVKGLAIKANMNDMDCSQWYRFYHRYGSFVSKSFQNSLSSGRKRLASIIKKQSPWSFLSSIDIYAKHWHWKSYHLGALHVLVSPYASSLKLTLNSKEFVGDVVWSSFKTQWQAQFKTFVFPDAWLPVNDWAKDTNISSPKKTFDWVSKIPAFTFSADQFVWKQQIMSDVHLQLVHLKNTLLLKQLAFSAPGGRVSLVASRTVGSKHAISSVKGSLQASDFGLFINHFYPSRVFEGGRGVFKFDLSWPGRWVQFKLGYLNGLVDLALKNGSFIKLSSKTDSSLGLAKLLSVFSLDAWPNRLSSHFHDLDDMGLSFNHLNMHGDMNQGLLRLSTFTLDGSIAKVLCHGYLDFLNKRTEMLVDVSPYITSSLPLVATVAGGPIVGAFTWVMNKVMTPGIQKGFRFKYQVHGSLSHPTIQRVV